MRQSDWRANGAAEHVEGGLRIAVVASARRRRQAAPCCRNGEGGLFEHGGGLRPLAGGAERLPYPNAASASFGLARYRSPYTSTAALRIVGNGLRL